MSLHSGAMENVVRRCLAHFAARYVVAIWYIEVCNTADDLVTVNTLTKLNVYCLLNRSTSSLPCYPAKLPTMEAACSVQHRLTLC
jgi:hypothetical protein